MAVVTDMVTGLGNRLFAVLSEKLAGIRDWNWVFELVAFGAIAMVLDRQCGLLTRGSDANLSFSRRDEEPIAQVLLVTWSRQPSLTKNLRSISFAIVRSQGS